MWHKSIFIGVAVMVVVTLTGCQYIPFLNDKSGKAPPTADVVRDTIETSVIADGKIKLPQAVNMGFSGAAWGAQAGNTILKELNVSFGSKVEKGQVVARLDTSSLERDLPVLKHNVQAALLNVDKTKEPLYKPEDIARAEAAVTGAKASLEYAREALIKARDPYTNNDFANAESAIRQANNILENAQRSLETTKQEWDLKIVDAIAGVFPETMLQQSPIQTEYYLSRPNEVLEITKKQRDLALAKGQNTIDDARVNLADAEFKLQDMLSKRNGEALDIKQKESAIIAAEVALDTAQQTVALMKRGPEPLDIKLAEVQVTLAQLVLDKALQQIKDSFITAPFDGITGNFEAKVGEVIQPLSFSIPLVDPSKIRVDAEIEEFDVIHVKPGMPAVITLDAFEEQSFRGTVKIIAPTATEQHGVVLYNTIIDLQNPGAANIELRGGLSVTVRIITNKKDNALLVPKSSVMSQDGQHKVKVFANGTTEERVVKTGLSNNQFTEILEGVTEGDKVLLQPEE